MSRSVFRQLATTRVMLRPTYNMYQHYRQQQQRRLVTTSSDGGGEVDIPGSNEFTDHDQVIKSEANPNNRRSHTGDGNVDVACNDIPRPYEFTDHDLLIRLEANFNNQKSQAENVSQRLDYLSTQIKDFYADLKGEHIRLGSKLDRSLAWLITMFLGAGAWKTLFYDEGMKVDIVERTKGKVMKELDTGAVELRGMIGETSGKAAEVPREKGKAVRGPGNLPAV